MSANRIRQAVADEIAIFNNANGLRELAWCAFGIAIGLAVTAHPLAGMGVLLVDMFLLNRSKAARRREQDERLKGIYGHR